MNALCKRIAQATHDAELKLFPLCTGIVFGDFEHWHTDNVSYEEERNKPADENNILKSLIFSTIFFEMEHQKNQTTFIEKLRYLK